VISDDLANQVTFSLVALPLVTIAVGWAAAAATAGLRRAGPASAPRHPLLPAPAGGPAPAVEGRASRPAREDHPHPGDGTPGAIRAATPRRRRTGYVLLLCAVLAAAVVLAFVGILRG